VDARHRRRTDGVMTMASLLIKNATVITMDDDRTVHPAADILVVDGRIAQIGPVDAFTPDAEVIDATGMIALPGLVDTHRHTWQTPVRGILADGNIPDYLRGIRLQLAPLYRPEDMYAGNYVGALDALNCGVTTIVDYCHNILTPDHAHAAVAGLRDAGVRALYGHGLTPITSNTWSQLKGGGDAQADPATLSARAQLASEIASEHFSSPDQLVRFGICPQELAIAPADEVALEFELARELGARITLHANQVCVRQLFRDVEVLAGRKLLGPDLLLVHCTFNTAQEWATLEDSGTMVSVCAESEMQMGMGFPVIAEATRHTPGPSLGIDCVSAVGGDMLAHARLVLQATRWRADEPGYREFVAPQRMTWSALEALEWLTRNGAAAAGFGDRVGQLVAGFEADVVLLRMDGVSTAGWRREDAPGAVISQANARDVDTVLVRGRVVKRRGTLVHVDPRAAVGTLMESHDFLIDAMERRGGFIPQPPVDIPLYRERA
jgi:5-methylthioadenosine/S-adenosylhomocysteine deaminase